MMYVHVCFMEEVKNDICIQKRHWYILYEVLDKSVLRFIRVGYIGVESHKRTEVYKWNQFHVLGIGLGCRLCF